MPHVYAPLKPQAAVRIPSGEHERRKGKWTMKLLAAHFVYFRVMNDPSVPSTSAVCTSAMGKILSMRVLGRMAVHWGVAAVPTIRDAVLDHLWVPAELHEVAKAYVYYYTTQHGLDGTLVSLLTPYFDACFVHSTHTSSAIDKRVPTVEVDEHADWAAVYTDTLKELRLVTETTQSLPEGWVGVQDLIRRVSRKHPALLHASPLHFRSRVLDHDAMLKLQSLKAPHSAASGGETFFMRASYCHRDGAVASAVLASHVRISSSGRAPPTSPPIYEFVESSRKLSASINAGAKAHHGVHWMVPHRPMLLFPESRVTAIRKRCLSDDAYAKVNKIKFGDSGFAPCDPKKVADLIITALPPGSTPRSQPATDAQVEVVNHQYHAVISHELREEGGVIAPMDGAMRCYALIPVSFAETIPHLFPVLTKDNVPAFSDPEFGGFLLSKGGTVLPPLPPHAPASPTADDVARVHPAAAAAPTVRGAFDAEVDAVRAWLDSDDEFFVLRIAPTDERKALSRVRSLVQPLVEQKNSEPNARHTIAMGDPASRPDLLQLASPLNTSNSIPTIVFCRAPSPTYCAERLAVLMLGEGCLGDGSPQKGRALCALLETVLHPTRYELLEFLGDAVIDYIAAFRAWGAGVSRDGACEVSAAAVGQAVNRETNNASLSKRVPNDFVLHLQRIMGRSVAKHYADAYEAIVGALYIHGFATFGTIDEGLALARRFVDSSA